MTEKMPVLFLGHGSPMNAIEENEFAQAWVEMGDLLYTLGLKDEADPISFFTEQVIYGAISMRSVKFG